LGVRKVEHGWVRVAEITVHYDRYFSRLPDEEFEALKEAIRGRGPDFSLEHPITVNAARGHHILRDGYNRLAIFRELGYEKIYSIIRVFDDDKEALEDAKWGSIEDNWHRGQRDPKQLIALVKEWTAGMEENQAVKLLIQRGFSKAHAYRLILVARDEELSKKVASGAISLRAALEIAQERKSKIVSHVRQTEEKPEEEVISAGEAVSELQKIAKIQRMEISAKKPRKGEVSERRGRPRKEEIPGLTAGLKKELEYAFRALGIEDESERAMLMCEAAEILGPHPVEVQVEAVKRWRESGGSIGFQQALQEAKKPEEEKVTFEDVLKEVETYCRLKNYDLKDMKDMMETVKKEYKGVEPSLALKAVRLWLTKGGTLEKALRMAKGIQEEPESPFKCPRCGAPLKCSCGWPKPSKGGGQ